MDINKEKDMSTKTKFEEIKENLNRDYYDTRSYANASGQYCDALKIAVDELLNVLNEMVKN